MVRDFQVGIEFGVGVCIIVGTQMPVEQREEVLSEFVFEFEARVVFGAVYVEAELIFLDGAGAK